jgi:AmiR/NasT family two-component response regulator
VSSRVSTPELDGDVATLLAEVATLRERAAQLEHALRSRIVIEQAKGVLAERLGVDVDAAFEILRGAARARQTRLHMLAEQVVSSRSTPPPVEHELLRRRREEG